MNAFFRLIRYFFQAEDTLLTRPETGAFAPKHLVLAKNLIWFCLTLGLCLLLSRIH